MKPRTTRNVLPSMSAAEAVIAAYCEARAASVSGHLPKRQASATQANMIAQLERAGLKPVARH